MSCHFVLFFFYHRRTMTNLYRNFFMNINVESQTLDHFSKDRNQEFLNLTNSLLVFVLTLEVNFYFFYKTL